MCVRLTPLVAQLVIRVQPLGPACTVHGAVIRPIPNMCWHINVVEWWVHVVGTALLQSYIQTLPLRSLLLIYNKDILLRLRIERHWMLIALLLS